MKWLPNMRLKGASQDLMGDLQRAKAEAIKRNREIEIEFNTVACGSPGGGYTVFIDNVDDDIWDTDDDELIKQVLMKGVEMYFSSQKNKLIPAEKSAIFPAIHSFG
jgi:Tfp pilus assembly protein FimT